MERPGSGEVVGVEEGTGGSEAEARGEVEVGLAMILPVAATVQLGSVGCRTVCIYFVYQLFIIL